MTTIEIKFNKQSVLERIKTHCYYTGEARKQIGYPETLAAAMQAGDDDDEQLNDHIKAALCEAAKLLSQLLPSCRMHQGSDTLFTIVVPHNFPTETVSLLESTIEYFSIMHTLQLWLSQHKPDEANIASGEAQKTLYHLRELLSIRKRPTMEDSSSYDTLIKI